MIGSTLCGYSGYRLCDESGRSQETIGWREGASVFDFADFNRSSGSNILVGSRSSKK